MSLVGTLPLFKPGATGRNTIVAVLYVVLAFILLPILILIFPFALLALIGTNYKGFGDRVADSPLGVVPGISSGGWTAGIIVFVIIFIAYAGLGAILPGDDSTGAPDADVNGPAEGPVDDGEIAAQTDDVADTSTEIVTSAGQTDTGPTDNGGDPTASATARVSQTIANTNTPVQTVAPTTVSPTQTATAEPSQVEEYEPQSFEGSGSRVESGITIEGGLVVVELTHDGDSNFQARLIRGGTEVEYLTNAIGAYDGEVAIYAPSGEYQLEIRADGDWTATVRQPRFTDADVRPATGVTAEGSQHGWIGPLSFEGGEVVSVQVEGDGHLAVWLTDHQGSKVALLANDIAPYESETVVTQSGIGLLVIETDSNDWRIEIRR
ncbi:hypothetical protein [Haloarchaeobius sp. HRN-SO-5]|uniref:hypothetical protein n=1 Tax=Haloarchaeobius sp. HRN-SO-5 TaxID=3446118 RepID=UPI003EC04F1D